MSTFSSTLLAGKVAIVTGGGTGIGRAITRALLAHGAQVAIVSRKGEVLERAAEELSEETGLGPTQISLLPGVEIDERSAKGNLAVRYLVARLVDLQAELAAPPDEARVVWMTVEEARARLTKPRREVLRAALSSLGAE